MAKSAKKPLIKRWWFWPVVVILAVSAIAGSGNDDKEEEGQEVRKSFEDAADENNSVSQNDSQEPGGSESEKSGTHTLPCGMKIQLWDKVRNDVTGNWRRSTTSDSFAPADYALEYYQEMFSSDDEIHSVWNATLNTTTRITASGGLLFVDTFEYVDGEEHDAKSMFSGQLLDSRIIDIETGEPYQEPDPEESKPEQPEPETTPEPDPETRADPAPEPVVEPEIIPEPEPEKTINGRSSNSIVYVSKRSNTIHSVNDCGGMKNYREMTIGEADGRGYKYCPNCW